MWKSHLVVKLKKQLESNNKNFSVKEKDVLFQTKTVESVFDIRTI